MTHLQVEDETWKRDAPNLPNSFNMNYVEGKSKKNNKRKAAENSNNKSKNDKKNNHKCYGCNKKGHYIKDYNPVKKLKRDVSQAKANLFENKNQECR